MPRPVPSVLTFQVADEGIAQALRGEAERISNTIGRTITVSQVVGAALDQYFSSKGWSHGRKLTAIVET